MEMKGQRLLQADRVTTWTMLNDATVLRQCVPGCESLAATSENAYELIMNAAVGPVKARFKGKMTLTEIEPPNRYRLLFDGQSGQAGFARGEAKVELKELSPGETQLSYAATAQVGGKLAQIGSRLIDAAAGATADKFFECFAAQVAARTAASTASAGDTGGQAPVAIAARIGLWSWLKSFLRHLLARRRKSAP
jgi:carbon monoxide dehydrogenase subunit G